jgi:riboflavin kinase/FMN adenylyltransferase
MNIGVRPTFDGHEPTIEVHVIRYEGDLYGKRLVVEPMHWWRAERKFDTLDLLVAQMNEDVKNTDNYFEKRDEYEK